MFRQHKYCLSEIRFRLWFRCIRILSGTSAGNEQSSGQAIVRDLYKVIDGQVFEINCS